MIKLGNIKMNAEHLKGVIQTFEDAQIEEIAYWVGCTLGVGLPSGYSTVKEAMFSMIEEDKINPQLATAIYAALIGMRIEQQREKEPSTAPRFRILRSGVMEKEPAEALKTFRIIDDGRDDLA
jgi:hypothetical protein